MAPVNREVRLMNVPEHLRRVSQPILEAGYRGSQRGREDKLFTCTYRWNPRERMYVMSTAVTPRPRKR